MQQGYRQSLISIMKVLSRSSLHGWGGYVKVCLMKVLAILILIVILLVGLPLLHGLLVFESLEEMVAHPTAMSFFYLFTIPAWAVAIMVFVVETCRRGFIRSRSRISNTLMLGLFGMVLPAAGLALSPVSADIGLQAFASIAMMGLVVGLSGAVLFNFVTSLIEKMTNT